MPHPRSEAGPPPARDPARADSLDWWCAHDWHDGLQVPALPPLERLLVRTCNHLYELIVLNPLRAEVMVRGGCYFPEFTRARVAGSSLGSSFLKLHGIYTGFRLELHADEQAIVTSPVRDIRRDADRGQM
jgi:hypothetical protein